MLAGLLSLVLLFSGGMFGQDTSPDQLLTRAVDEQQKGDFPAAIRDYQAVLAVRPATLAARVNLGAALAHTGQLDAAIEQYKAALKLAPQLGSVHLDLGLAYSRKGDLPDALDQYEAAHRASPREVRIAILLGDAQARSGKAADAIALLTPLEPANAANPDFEYALGESLIRGGHPRDGAARVEKSASMTNSADAWMLAGSTLLDLNEFAQARRDLDNAMRLDPRLPGIATLDGTARDKDGDAKAAEPVFRQALQQNPSDFDANLYLGYQVGYENKGNIFLDGVDNSRNFEFAELPKDSSSFTEIALGGVSIASPGGVQWDGKHVTVGDAKSGDIYQTNGAGGKVEGTTSLSGSDGIFQYFIGGKKVIGPNAYSSNAGIWKYPAGGSPTMTITSISDPFGAAISKAPK